jgi:EAL and modified HD-GYP domain-containing signal transduction protein
MRNMAERVMPEHADEAFMVGILEPVKREIGEEIKEILVKAGVSEYVVNGLLNSDSKLGKLRELAEKLMELCDSLVAGKDVKLPEEFSVFTKEELIEGCLESERRAQAILSTL